LWAILEYFLISIRDVDILKEKYCGVKVNVNYALKEVMKAQMGSRGIALLFL